MQAVLEELYNKYLIETNYMQEYYGDILDKDKTLDDQTVQHILKLAIETQEIYSDYEKFLANDERTICVSPEVMKHLILFDLSNYKIGVNNNIIFDSCHDQELIDILNRIAIARSFLQSQLLDRLQKVKTVLGFRKMFCLSFNFNDFIRSSLADSIEMGMLEKEIMTFNQELEDIDQIQKKIYVQQIEYQNKQHSYEGVMSSKINEITKVLSEYRFIYLKPQNSLAPLILTVLIDIKRKEYIAALNNSEPTFNRSTRTLIPENQN